MPSVRFALLLVLIVLAVPARAADALFPPGSHIGLVPPAGLVANGNFQGFVDHERDAAIIVIEMPATAYAEIEKTMTQAALKKQGVIQEKRETLSLKTGKAFLVVGRQQAEGTLFRKWIMVAAAPEMTALVTAQIPDAAKNVYPDAAIRSALASLVTRATVPIEEQLGLLPFKLDDTAGLRPVRVAAATALLLTDGPKDEVEANEQPHLIIAVVPGGPDPAADRDAFARNFFGGLAGLKNIRIINSEMMRLSGQQVHEIMAEAKDLKSDKDLKVVQWLRFGGSGFLHIVGIAPKDGWAENFTRFRTVRDGIAPR